MAVPVSSAAATTATATCVPATATAEPHAGTLAVTLAQVLTVGAHTRIEFKRDDDGSYVDVEMPRSEFTVLREQLGLRSGSRVHLRARRITRFADGAAQRDAADPAAMI